MGDLFDKLEENFKSEIYPFHMPGHKRRLAANTYENLYGIDITEIEGFDDLHHPEGILKEYMDEATRYYGTKQTFYLVNGSSCGNLAAICGLTDIGDKILVARNCHKSVYNAIKLRKIEASYLTPDENGEIKAEEVWNIFDLKKSDETDNNLKEIEYNNSIDKNYKVCVITSPTYEGVVSDVKKIAEICHKNGVLLVVDEAHGAHFLADEFPKSALKCGADVVIQSVHKTLPSLTQTALLHVNSDRVDIEKIKEYLGIFQSSSPSYILMASIENCISYMEKHGREELKDFSDRIDTFYQNATKYYKAIKFNRYKDAFAHDKSKIIVCLNDKYKEKFKETFNDGFGILLSNVLRYNHKIEVEMATTDYVVLMTSIADKTKAFERLFYALDDIDRCIQKDIKKLKKFDEINKKASTIDLEYLRENIGKRSEVFIYAYPPGSPKVAVGDLITKDLIFDIEEDMAEGLRFYQV